MSEATMTNDRLEHIELTYQQAAVTLVGPFNVKPDDEGTHLIWDEGTNLLLDRTALSPGSLARAMFYARAYDDVPDLIEEVRRCRELLAKAYHSGHREGWEDGPSVNEVMGKIHNYLCNAGMDPNDSKRGGSR